MLVTTSIKSLTKTVLIGTAILSGALLIARSSLKASRKIKKKRAQKTPG